MDNGRDYSGCGDNIITDELLEHYQGIFRKHNIHCGVDYPVKLNLTHDTFSIGIEHIKHISMGNNIIYILTPKISVTVRLLIPHITIETV